MEHKLDLAELIGKRLREIRKSHNLSLKELAGQAGLSSSFLSRTELGQAMPSLPTLNKIAMALKIEIGSLFKSDENEKFAVSREGKRPAMMTERGTKGEPAYEVEYLAEGFKDPYMEPFVVKILKRVHDGFDSVRHGGQELMYVLEGKLEMTLGEKTLVLKKGDSVYYSGESPHKAISLSKKPAKTLNVHFLPGRHRIYAFFHK